MEGSPKVSFKELEVLNGALENYFVSRMLAEKGGKIEVTSVVGKGSIFSVYFKYD